MEHAVLLREVTELDLQEFYSHQKANYTVAAGREALTDLTAFLERWRKILDEPKYKTRTIVADGERHPALLNQGPSVGQGVLAVHPDHHKLAETAMPLLQGSDLRSEGRQFAMAYRAPVPHEKYDHGASVPPTTFGSPDRIRYVDAR